MRETRWRNAVLAAAGLAVALAGAEAAVRLLDVPPSPLAPLHVPSYRLLDNPVLRYGYRPDLPADHAPYDPMHRGMATNARGFREGPIAVPKPPGTLRILALGDSTTAGLGIPERSHTWPARLERRLRAVSERPLEVLNLGVGGYDPHQEAELLRVEGLALEPDAVLVLVCANDLQRGVDGGVYEALLRAREHLDTPAPGLAAQWVRQSRLLFVVRHRLRALVAREPRGSARLWQDVESNPLEAGLALFRRLSERHDLPVLVFLLPALDGTGSRYAHHDLHRRMEAVARRVGGLPWIDLLDDLSRAGPPLRQLSLDGLHPNRLGAAAVAEVVFRELRRRGWPDALAAPD